MLRYSIVIVTYRRHSLLCDTLRALAPLIDAAQGEVIVVDQCPPGPLPDDVLATPALRYITPDTPSMVRARNLGIELARGEVVLFLDDDVIPLPTLIEAHLSAYADSQVGGVAGRILDPGDDVELAPTGSLAVPVADWERGHFNDATAGDALTVRGCNMSFRRELLVRLGGFDPQIEMFRDDTDMSLRVRAAGYRVRFVPDATLVHLNASTGGTRGPTAQTDCFTAEWRMYRQHYRHYRDNLYFLLVHFTGSRRLHHLREAYTAYVGLSRWPWRLVAKNCAFLLALARAAELARYRRGHPCRLTRVPS